jgi:FkbM family methyltransferase
MLIDIVRETLESVVPSNVYNPVAGFYSSVKTAARMGINECLRLRHVAKAAPGKPVAFQFPGISHPVLVRPGGSDATTAEASLVRQYHGCLRPKFPVSLIVDAGAYGGYTSVFFANRYPDAHIIALEPDPDNFVLAQINLLPYIQQVKLLSAAIWHRPARLRVFPAQRSDSTWVAEDSGDEGYHCSGIDLISLLEESGQQRINIFKCDIEGAEESLFSKDSDAWIEKTDSILMEIHGPKERDAVYSAMRRHPFKVFTNRELHVFYRTSILPLK